ncbi:MAG TPA: TonB family protein [Thermoanaerobaculia bacterium]
MAARNKPYEQFGPYILYKKLEADALGDLWRAGRIDGRELGATVALRRLSGGRRDALLASTHAVSNILPRLSGASFVREQHAGLQDGVPFLTWDYAGGRSLRHVIERARGGNDIAPNPLPIDQAIAIAEKIALSLATMADFRETSGGRLSHGALIPHFVWITDEGEIRVAAQQIGPGLIASLDEPEVAAEIGRYFPPEYRGSGRAGRDTDVYSMGAILFLIVSGQEPPDSLSSSDFGADVRGARTMSGEAIPDDIRAILDRSLTLDSAMRFPTMGEMKQALSSLTGKYSATTFNLAFYLSTLLKKEMEAEAIERTRESKITVGPYLETAIRPAAAAAAVPAPALPQPVMFANTIEKPKSRMPLMLSIAALALAAAGAGGYLMIARQTKSPADSGIAAAQITTAPQPPVISEPVMASPEQSEPDLTQDDPSLDPEAQKRAFDEAVKQKLQAEMMKLQSAFLAELQQKQPSSAPASVPSSPAPVAVESTLSPEEAATLAAAQLEQQRRDARLAEAEEQRPAASQPIAQTPAPATPSSPSPAQAPAIREGDLVEVSLLDSMPRPTRPIRPTYPPMAARQKVAATIILTAFLTENGDVTDVRVLRGDPRYGLNDAAIRAMRATKFTPPMKDGKRVRTWFPQTIEFNPN